MDIQKQIITFVQQRGPKVAVKLIETVFKIHFYHYFSSKEELLLKAGFNIKKKEDRNRELRNRLYIKDLSPKKRLIAAIQKLGPHTTIYDISKLAGFSDSMFHHYFKNKDELIRIAGFTYDKDKERENNISKIKEKIMHSLKELGPDVSTDKIAQHAGYKSDKVITKYFGNKRKLLYEAGYINKPIKSKPMLEPFCKIISEKNDYLFINTRPFINHSYVYHFEEKENEYILEFYNEIGRKISIPKMIKFDEKLAWIIGVRGDKNDSYGAIGICNTEMSVIKYFRELMKVYGFPETLQGRSSYDPTEDEMNDAQTLFHAPVHFYHLTNKKKSNKICFTSRLGNTIFFKVITFIEDNLKFFLRQSQKSVICNFIAGFIDSEGHIDKRNKRVYFSNLADHNTAALVAMTLMIIGFSKPRISYYWKENETNFYSTVVFCNNKSERLEDFTLLHTSVLPYMAHEKRKTHLIELLHNNFLYKKDFSVLNQILQTFGDKLFTTADFKALYGSTKSSTPSILLDSFKKVGFLRKVKHGVYKVTKKGKTVCISNLKN